MTAAREEIPGFFLGVPFHRLNPEDLPRLIRRGPFHQQNHLPLAESGRRPGGFQVDEPWREDAFAWRASLFRECLDPRVLLKYLLNRRLGGRAQQLSHAELLFTDNPISFFRFL